MVMVVVVVVVVVVVEVMGSEKIIYNYLRNLSRSRDWRAVERRKGIFAF
tara:strand:+ start:267 stop:413 length:147 start_codon:yes stop_codon:yes gene_type:complete